MTTPFRSKVSSKYGAPMGRRSDNPANLEATKCVIRQVPFVDGDYDPGGAYWGHVPGSPLFCVWNAEDTVVYLRAVSLEAAKAELADYSITFVARLR